MSIRWRHIVIHFLAACAAVIAVVPSASAQQAAQAQPAPQDPLATELERRLVNDIRPLVDSYCVKCHSGPEPKGDVDLTRITTLRAAMDHAEDLSMARELVRTGEMPPKDKPRPSEHERLIMEQWLEAALAYVPPDAAPDPGWFTIHRLNRSEYRNTLRDLLGIDPKDFDVAAKLPRDDTGYGFDNIADVLTVSPLAIEAYLDAAERAVAHALGPVFEIGSSPRQVVLSGSANGSPLQQGGFFMYSNGEVRSTLDIPVTGEYLIRLGAWETHGGDENAKLALRVDGKAVETFSISGTREAPQEIEARLTINAGSRKLAVLFINDFWQKDVADRNLGIEWVTIAGPLDEATTRRPEAWTRLFAPGAGIADEDARAVTVLNAFAARAFRRHTSAAERASLASLYRAGRKAGLSFEFAVRQCVTAVLVSPNFLYRSIDNPDSGNPGEIYTLDGYELASRLSYFLWSSMPDEELLAVASDGRILDDEVLRAQARRMLADPKADAFIENFSGQWLQLRSLDTLAIDRAKFPEYDDSLRADMIAEARAYFGDVVRGDGNILSLISGEFVFVNERLAAFYGIEGVQGPELRRVPLAPGSPRGGILTMGAVLTVTSNTTRTSPVKRGLFVLDQILGTPPPPPPADIPPLEQAHTAGPDATLREQLAAHVANPTCAVCHNRLDPLGLAFENFSAIGKWRDEDGGKPIDAGGTLPGGQTLSGVRDLKAILLSRGDQFIETLSGKVLTYAIGRGLEPFDRPAVRRIAEQTRAAGGRMGALIEAVVLSDTFRTCRGRESRDD